MSTNPMTVGGQQKLEVELDQLKREERPRIIQAIAEARAHGDLKENAEYHAAKEQQGFIEARIAELESKLSHAQVIDVTQMPNTGKVIFGVTVTLLKVEDDTEMQVQIVGEDEADIKAGKLSYQSPIARAIIGKSLDDAVEVKTPSGAVEYEIVSIEHS